MDPRVERMADVIVDYCVGVQPQQWVTLATGVAGEPIAAACQAAILRAGGYPSIFLGTEELDIGFLNAASDDQLAYVSPLMRLLAEQVDVQIAILAPSNTRARMSVDPARTAIRQKAVEPIGEVRMRREAEGTYRWTIAQFPTQAAAQDAGMSLSEYEDFVYSACLINEPDPVGAWSALIARQQQLIDWITPRDVVHITGPGTDLTLRVAGRTWINDEGKVNFPGGEIFTAPLEDATEGHISFTFPGFLGGNEVSGVCLTFKEGRVVDADATSGKDFLMAMLDMDEGARVLGEFAFGTNYGITRFTKNTLFDEKIGGTLHMALGRPYPACGGTNVSALHWDMVFDLKDAEVTVDGAPFTVNGEFVV